MPKLIASVTHVTALGQDTIHRAHGALVSFLVEQRGMHLCRRLVSEALGAQGFEHLRPFFGTQHAR